ncbi:MAG TPA: hypothetical protein VEZ71_17870 [Archangium sp.]|nr:hypothetical protein [Archangium sp.]
MDLHPIAGVVWYAIGRFYEVQDGSLQDLDFSRPETFSRGEPIATFQRLSSVVGTSVGPLGTNLFSAALRSSTPFHFQGRSWNLERLLPHGITQLGVASTTAIPPPPGYKTVTPFVGSAMAAGGSVRWP